MLIYCRHDAGVHLIFSIQEKYKPESSGGAPGSDKVRLRLRGLEA